MLKKTIKHKNVFLGLLIGMTFSQSFAQYHIAKYTVNSGGSKITGGNYELTSSIGQTDASNTLVGSSYTMNGGFWHKNNDIIFKNGFE